MAEIVEIKGYHGTNSENLRKIVVNNFIPSFGDNEWLGDGSYFFVEGILDPKLAARNWAQFRAYDKLSGTHTQFGVISAIIETEKQFFLDLTTNDGLQTFNYLVQRCIKEIQKEGKRIKSTDYKDGYILNLARKKWNIPIHVSKGNFYIGFTYENKLKVFCRTPNCTISAVHKLECIKKDTIQLEN